MVSMIIFLFIAIMVVLIRRLKVESQDDYDWEDDFEEDEESENVDSDLYDSQNEETQTAVEETTLLQLKRKNLGKECVLDLLQKQKTGLCKQPGTEQGKTGWYSGFNG